MATPQQWRSRQHALNAWTAKMGLKGVAPLIPDGTNGPLTRRQIQHVKWWLGYNNKRTPDWTWRMHMRMLHGKSLLYSNRGMMRRGRERRVGHNRRWEHSHRPPQPEGIAIYDGRQCAAWMVPYMAWARAHTVNGRKWVGVLVSGYRTPEYSEHLCEIKCGRPSCPGTCAGRKSRHSQYKWPDGAIDVSDYGHFGEAMQVCPLRPRIFNALPSDRVHFSSQGN